jgi:endoglucanase
MLCCAPVLAAAQCDARAKAVQVNQLGFRIDAPRHAVVVSEAQEPLDWALVAADGATLIKGRTQVFGRDAASGQRVHELDFSAFKRPGTGLRLVVGCARSAAFAIEDRPYAALKRDALAYFTQSRSGVAIEKKYAGAPWARPAAHVDETATCRAGADRFGNQWPGCSYTLNPAGGWYDAGDQGKYVVNGGISVWTLMNLYERQLASKQQAAFPDGSAPMPEAGNGVNDLLDEARFELEFLLRMQAPVGAAARLPVNVKRSGPSLSFTSIDAGGMVHHKIADENWTALPTPPHLDRESRVLHAVSTAATLNLAAVAAQCARIWRTIDTAFADRCLRAARAAYDAARRNPAVYFISDFTGSGMYGDSDVTDEFFWAAAELAATTREARYREDVQRAAAWSERLKAEPTWGSVAPLGLMTLATVPGALDSDGQKQAQRKIIAAADQYASEPQRSGYHLPFADQPYVWGSNSSLLNRAIVLALAYDFTHEQRFRDAVVDVADYLLGRNPLGQSYISGYGEKPMRNPHHRFWAHSLDAALPSPPPGVLSGGPNKSGGLDPVARKLVDAGCAPQACWVDDIQAYSLNEVAINWNAPLVWVAAFLDER